MEVENKYSLLNEGEEQEKVTLAIDNALAEMMKDLSDLAEGSNKERIKDIESYFYGRIHYGEEPIGARDFGRACLRICSAQ